jgi:hypothetical protein
MCGPYAVVNAVRLVAEPHRRLKRAACAALFAELVDELAARDRLVQTLIEGCSSRLLARLLQRAALWLHRHHGLKLQIERPFTGRKPLAARELLPVLSAHLGQAGTVAIIDTGEHWTVAQATTRSKLLLFDSNGRTFMRLKKVHGRPLAERLHRAGTFLLTSK